MSLTRPLRRFRHTNALAWHIARRYLFSRERRALEWMVTAISIMGVAVGVATMIGTFGIYDGVTGHIINRVTAGVPSLSVHHPSWNRTDPDPAILARLRAHPAVMQAEPVLMQPAMMLLGTRGNQFVRVYAADEVAQQNIFGIILASPRDVLRPEPGKLLISTNLSTASLVGRDVTLVSQATSEGKGSLLPIPKTTTLKIQGGYTVGNSFIGRSMALASWADVRALCKKPKGVDSVFIKLVDPMAANEVKADLLKILPPDTTITSWIEDFEQMFSDMSIIKHGLVLMMLMTMLVSALNIIGTLTLIVLQKTREIGILRAMGASGRLVRRIFLAEGALVGVIGAVLGIALGLAFCWSVRYYQIPMPGNLFKVRTIPVQVRGAILLLTSAAAIAISTLAALAPAWRAGGLDPVVALRHE